MKPCQKPARAMDALDAYMSRLVAACALQLGAASEQMGAMKSPTADTEALVQIEAKVTDYGRFTDRGLCDAFYLFLSKATTDPQVQNNCAWYFYTAQSHLAEAEKLARAALASKPDPNMTDTLAHILFTTGRGEEAFRLERGAIGELKAAGRSAEAANLEKALKSWGEGKADQLLPPVH